MQAKSQGGWRQWKAASESVNQQQQQPQGTQPNNKKNQKAAFAGYSAEENKYKTTVESPSDPTERREKTALDEILSALIFKGEQISEASVKRLRQLELPPKEYSFDVHHGVLHELVPGVRFYSTSVCERGTIQNTLGSVEAHRTPGSVGLGQVF